MSRAIFLDRDGTINVEKHYLHKISDFEFLPGAVEAMRLLQREGFKLIIITNQSGIARGYYSENEFKILNEWMLNKLKLQGIIIDAVYFCPHLPDAKIEKYRVECNCRKPALGLYEKAIDEYCINVTQSFAIGDKLRDCSICEKYKCRGYLIGNSEEPREIERVKAGWYDNIEYAVNLLEATNKIVEDLKCIS